METETTVPEQETTANSRIEQTFSRAFANYKPPENITVSEWAEKYRVLSRESSAESGRWRNSRTPYLREIMDSFTDPKVEHITVVASSQVGKALHIDTPIPTPDGWSTMGELKRGDVVFDENGNTCHVVAATEVMTDRPCYKLTFSDGSEIIADALHQWRVESGYQHIERIMTTEDMAKDYIFTDSCGLTHNRYAVAVNKPLKTMDKELPFPPYTLGVWLGDGNSYSAQLTVSKQDTEIIDRVRAEGLNVRLRENGNTYNVLIEPKPDIHKSRYCIRGHDMDILGRTKKGLCAECARQYSKHNQYGFVMDEVKPAVPYGHARLKSLDLLNNKHIPREYLRAGYYQRIALLQGIMDSDGHITKKGRCEITLKSKRLIEDVGELLSTLGIKYTLHEKQAVCTNAVDRVFTLVYRISFMAYDDVPVFGLRRKLERMVNRASVGNCGGKRRVSEVEHRRITHIEAISNVPVKCIQVDSPSHLYLAGRTMIPTHNSEFELNAIGYIIDQDPGSILYIQPNLDDAKKFSRLRIAPMIRDSERLRSKVAEVKSRDSGNTMLQKSFPGGMLTIVGSQSASALASTPARYIIGDERDRWALSAGTEGDPWGLAVARTTTYYNRKMIDVSTPTIKGFSPIENSFNEGTQERWCHKCPHCGNYHNINFSDIKFEFEPVKNQRKKDYIIKSIAYCCPSCGCLSGEQEMRGQPAIWIADNPDAYARGHRSFWLNAFSSPWQPWSKIVYSFLIAKDDPEKLKVVFNTMLGELWEDRGELADEDTFMSRREDYGETASGVPVDLPDGVLILTCGVDTQDNRLEYEVVGHGYYGETWGIKKGVIYGDPNDKETWEQLDAVIDTVYKFKNGRGLTISFTAVDSGGHKTQSVYYHCKARESKRVFAIKGVGGEGVPYTKPPTKVKIVVNGKAIDTAWLYTIGVDAGKATIMSNLKVQEAGAKYCHFPIGESRGYDLTYFSGLLSEKLVMKSERGRTRWVWEKILGHERNEALDCRNYALAAFRILDPNLDAVKARLDGKPAKLNAQTNTTKTQEQKSRVKHGANVYASDW